MGDQDITENWTKGLMEYLKIKNVVQSRILEMCYRYRLLSPKKTNLHSLWKIVADKECNLQIIFARRMNIQNSYRMGTTRGTKKERETQENTMCHLQRRSETTWEMQMIMLKIKIIGDMFLPNIQANCTWGSKTKTIMKLIG